MLTRLHQHTSLVYWSYLHDTLDVGCSVTLTRIEDACGLIWLICEELSMMAAKEKCSSGCKKSELNCF